MLEVPIQILNSTFLVCSSDKLCHYSELDVGWKFQLDMGSQTCQLFVPDSSGQRDRAYLSSQLSCQDNNILKDKLDV